MKYKIVDAASNTVPIAYDTTAGSKVWTNVESAGFLGVINKTSEDIAVTAGEFADTKIPASDDGGIVLSGGGSTALDFIKIRQGDTIFIKSITGNTITTAKIYFFLK